MHEMIISTLRSPFLPTPFKKLSKHKIYFENFFMQILPSIDTQGFIDNALYVSDVSLEPAESIISINEHKNFFKEYDLEFKQNITAILNIFDYQQPQVLLILAALLEAFENDTVGGNGSMVARIDLIQEKDNQKFHLVLPDYEDFYLYKEFEELFGADSVPDLYLSLTNHQDYLVYIWENLQHLSSFPDLRKRIRGIYYYAISSSKFLAKPIHGSVQECISLGISLDEINVIKELIHSSLSMYSTMIMHCAAMRVGLGINQKKIIKGNKNDQ
tara:strand:- start:1350 stop:2165 length:816 start_codon:yes stop_codon:yes gene_type:complete